MVPALRQRLGDEGTEALVEMMYATATDWRDDALNRFDQRLTQELSALKVDVTKELASMRVEILRWSFLFWITQLGAMAGLLAYMK
jgi:hypothetical protein